MCYCIVAIMLIDLIKKKDYNSLFTFGAAALVGFFMELAAVAVTDIYYYSDDFWISLGREPYQFPFFGGLMWGGLTVYGIKPAKKLKAGKLLTALAAGMFIVTMDILLDVVAVRLDGGFWTWVGNPINLEITQHTFMSVIWVNFLGYMIETPTVVLLTLRKNERVQKNDFKKQTLHMFLIALGAIGVTAVGSLLALFLNSVTDDWFACIAFSVLWITMIILMIRRAVQIKMRISSPKEWNLPMLLFWLAMYGYCLLAIISLGIQITCPWFLIMGVFFLAGTIYVAMAKEEKKE